MNHADRRLSTLLLGTFLTTGACSSAQMHDNRWSDARYAIRAAREAGAADHPPASRLLGRARRELMEAKRLLDDGDERNSALLLDRSEADAQLALQMMRVQEERRRAESAWGEANANDVPQR